MPVFVLACAVIYFYSKALITPDFRFTHKESLHLVPFGMYTLLLMPFYFSDSEIKLAYLSSQTHTLSWVLEVAFFNVVVLFYIGLSYSIVHRHQRHIKDVFSNLEKIRLDWLRNLLLMFGVIWVTAVLRLMTSHTGVGYEIKILTPLFLCLTIYLIGWFALRQPEILMDLQGEIVRGKEQESMIAASLEEQRPEQPVKFKHRPKYEHSYLTARDIARHKDNLITYLEREKPYTDPDLKLQNLSDHLGIPSYELSQIINTGLNRNFCDLINSFRIEEAKQRLTDPDNQHLTIIAIAYDVGFNSKSAFNTAFKKNTSMTPSQYKQSQIHQSIAA
jgi:AraC-like DNA-binding protein